MQRLEALTNDWLAYFRSEQFAGGCFFHTVKAEFDSRPDNAVREVVMEDVRQFLGLLAREVRKAQEAGDLDPTIEPEQLAFELDALGAASNQQFQLMQDPIVFDRAATAIRARLDSLTPPRPLVPPGHRGADGDAAALVLLVVLAPLARGLGARGLAGIAGQQALEAVEADVPAGGVARGLLAGRDQVGEAQPAAVAVGLELDAQLLLAPQ